MYNKTSAGVAVALLGGLLVAACGSFGATSGSEGEDGGSNEASLDGGGDSDGTPLDGGADSARPDGAIVPVVGVDCGTVTCAVGQGCCFTSMPPACTTSSACVAGFFVTCTKPSDCGSGGACCFDGARTSCAAASCGSSAPSLCGTGTDCKQGQCAALTCEADASPPMSPFKLCAVTPLLFKREALSCSLP